MEEMDGAFRQMLDARRADGEDRKEALGRLKEASRERLLRIVETKLRTAFVGPLAQFEEHFGQLWGRKRRPEHMTAQERAWWELYQKARNNILTNGNNQLRAVQAEVALYDVVYNGYRRVFPVAGAGGPAEEGRE